MSAGTMHQGTTIYVDGIAKLTGTHQEDVWGLVEYINRLEKQDDLIYVGQRMEESLRGTIEMRDNTIKNHEEYIDTLESQVSELAEQLRVYKSLAEQQAAAKDKLIAYQEGEIEQLKKDLAESEAWFEVSSKLNDDFGKEIEQLKKDLAESEAWLNNGFIDFLQSDKE